MIDTHDYPLHVESTGPKEGFLTSADGLPKLEVASPPEFGGPGLTWSPEHLFVAAVSGCLMTTFRAIAEMSRVEVVDYQDDAVGRLIREDSLYRMDRVVLRPRITITDPEQLERAHRLIQKAERACLISRSISAEIVLEPTIGVAELG
ncbi:MAG: OsmC family protein [Acidimicrobiia bacterium]|nr:OsmC family protein [Acidimicrobiia bacterium]